MRSIVENIIKSVKSNKKKIIAMSIKAVPLILIFYVFNRIGHIYRLLDLPITKALMPLLNNLKYIFVYPAPTFRKLEILWGTIPSLIVYGLYKSKVSQRKKFKQGIEYGSAEWGTNKDIEPYADNENFDNNLLLTATEKLIMNGRPKNRKYNRNKNVLVVGGSGSGKTRFYIKPNLMQRHSSYVVTDPKGSILTECGYMLRRQEKVKDINGKVITENYKIKVFNTINFDKSMHYNPFHYIKTERDILKFVNVLIANTKGEGDKSGEDFWVKAERLYFMALIGFIIFELPEHQHNINSLLELINMSEAKEDQEDHKNEVDYMFEEVDSDSFAARQYHKYKMAAGKTAKSILISVGARLAVFDIAELREITSYDEMELDKLGGFEEIIEVNRKDLKIEDRIIAIGDEAVEEIVVTDKNIEKYKTKNDITYQVKRLNTRKTALFIIIDDTDSSFNFLAAIMYSQMFNILSNKAADEFGGRLPVHVRFLIDEFANIGQIPNFEKLIATLRSREISASIVLQTNSQLKGIYKDHADTIIGNCDSQIFLGGTEETTLKSMSEKLGKETIDTMNTSLSYAQQKTHGQNYQKLGRELMSRDELQVMDGEKCILQLRGVRPFFSKKYDIKEHPRYRYLDEGKQGMVFDSERYILAMSKKHKMKNDNYKELGVKEWLTNNKIDKKTEARDYDKNASEAKDKHIQEMMEELDFSDLV